MTTHLQSTLARAKVSAAAAARQRAAAVASAVVTWLLGFEKEAVREVIAAGFLPGEALALLRERAKRYCGAGSGVCQRAAFEITKGLSQEMQNVVSGLAAEVDSLQAYSPAAFRALLHAMKVKAKKAKRTKVHRSGIRPPMKPK